MTVYLHGGSGEKRGIIVTAAARNNGISNVNNKKNMKTYGIAA